MKVELYRDYSSELSIIKKIPVIEDYILIVGGGKFGKIALEYALKEIYSKILIIDKEDIKFDKDPNSFAGLDIEKIKKIDDLKDFLKPDSKDEILKTNNRKFGFFKTDLTALPQILEYGIPKFLIPVVPKHISAILMLQLLEKPFAKDYTVDFQAEKTEKKINYAFTSSISKTYFDNIAAQISNDVIFHTSYKEGIILLSYAKEGEICPENCIGPPDYCPNFKRKKPKTITQIVSNIKNVRIKDLIAINIESYQQKAGLGGIKGENIKIHLENFLKEIINRISKLPESITSVKKPDTFKILISTSCNCHGVINIFELVELD